MEWTVAGACIIAAIIGAVLLGVPVAVSLGLVSVAFIWALSGSGVALGTVALEFMGFWSGYTLLTLPLFILMGEFLFAGGVAGDLFEFASKWLRRVPGGLAMVSIGTGALFGTLSGSGLAGIATIGVLAGPEMLKRGYDKRLVSGTIASAGSLAVLIPPSTMAVLYAILVGVSVGQQLMAGFIPGLILAATFGLMIIIWVRLRPGAAPMEPPVSWKERVAVIRKLVLPAFIAIVVLGCIYTGITTVTEAAAMGALAAIIVAIAYRRISPKAVLETGMSAMRTSCFILLIAVGGKLLSWCLTYYLIPQNIVAIMTALPLNRYAIVVLIQILFIFMGMFIDPISIMVVSMPILVPVLTALQFDLVWFGVVFLINMEVAIITPPLGFALYIVRGIMPDELTLGDVLRGGLLFCICDLAVLALLIAFPIIAKWLPNLMIA